jgi:hypothetical protein
VFLTAWTALGAVVGPALEVASAAQTEMALPERGIVSAYLLILRYLPYLLLPVILSPPVVVLLWVIPWTRPSLLESPECERRHLAQWVLWLAVVAVTVCVALVVRAFRPGLVPFGLWLWALMAFTWAYAGALHRAFRVQSLRKTAGSSKIDSNLLAIGAAVTVPFQLAGAVIPVWVLWASTPPRRAAQQRIGPDGDAQAE